MAPPRRSRNKHKPMRDDGSTISSGLSSAAGLTYTLPSTYQTKSKKPNPVQKAQTKQLLKLPLPPPRPKRARSNRSMSTDNATVVSSTDNATVASYTSRVSKVSIKPREPVLKSSDPLSKAMEEKIVESQGEKPKEPSVKTDAKISAKPPPEHPNKGGSFKHHGFAPLAEDPDDPIEEGIPTQVISAPGTCGPVVLPPPPPLDSLETYSLGTSDFISKYDPQQSYWRKWRLVICIVSLLLLAVIAAAVVSVVLVLGNNKDNGNSEVTVGDGDEPSAAPMASPAPTILRQPTLDLSPPPTAAPTITGFAPIAAPVSTPSDILIDAPVSAPSDVPNLERLIDFFSEQDEATELALLDTDGPQYRAMQWLESDVQQNEYTFASASDRILQRGTLAIFYYSTLGDVQWTSSTDWLDSATSECTWYGTVCAADTETIQSLELAENNLGGEIPQEIGLLASLDTLDLNNNGIRGSIPTQIGQLTLLSE